MTRHPWQQSVGGPVSVSELRPGRRIFDEKMPLTERLLQEDAFTERGYTKRSYYKEMRYSCARNINNNAGLARNPGTSNIEHSTSNFEPGTLTSMLDVQRSMFK